MARTPGGRGFIPITQASCLKDQAGSWYPLMQSRLGCVLWSLQPKDHQPESGVLSATSFSLCVSVPGFPSPREQCLPSAFRVPKSFIKLGVLELGSPWALLAPSQELSRSPPPFLRTIKRSEFLTQPGPSTHAPITVQSHASISLFHRGLLFP